MNFESVLIITYGRSGSTLLQGLLNSIDGCVVRGENHNMCYGLYLAWKSLRNAKREQGKGESSMSVTSPWFGAALLEEERFIEDARALVYHQLMPKSESVTLQCVGFKEIRYLPVDFTKIDLGDYLDFLAKLFPTPAFIVLTRNHDQVANSAWWKNSKPEQVKLRLKTFETQTAAYAKGKSFVYFIDYQDMTNKTDKLKQMFEFLGAPYEADKVEGVLSTKHSYAEKPKKSPAKPAAPDKPQQYVIEQISCLALAHFSLDKLSGPVDNKNTISLKGIAALSSAADGDFSLIVKDSSGEHPVVWGLPSPVFAQKHPGIPRADLSRFKTEGLQLDKGDVVEVFLVDKQGGYKCLARISLK